MARAIGAPTAATVLPLDLALTLPFNRAVATRVRIAWSACVCLVTLSLNWEPTHLFKRILPRMRELGLTEPQIHTLLVDNPARFFRGQEPPQSGA